MNPIIHNILHNLETGNEQEQERCILYITMILEMNTLSISECGRVGQYLLLLPWNLIFISLTSSEQTEIAEKLSQIFISSEKILHGILWAFSKTEERTGLFPLLDIIRDRSKDFDDINIFQATLSLGHCFYDLEESEIDLILSNKDIAEFVDKIPESESAQ